MTGPAAPLEQGPAGATGDRARSPKTARGSYRRSDLQHLNPQIVARFDRGTFDEIAAFAAARRLSFNAALRWLAISGLKAARKGVPR